MFFFESFCVGVGLSMDAFAITLANMMAYEKQMRGAKKWLMPLFFAIFQGLMPLLGAFLGGALEKYVTRFAPWVMFVVLAFVGGKMLWDAFRPGGEEVAVGQKNCSCALIILQAVATSIDAFAVGVGYAVSGQNAFAAVPIIAVTTFVICTIGVLLGGKAAQKLENKATIFGGLILIAIGVVSLFG